MKHRVNFIIKVLHTDIQGTISVKKEKLYTRLYSQTLQNKNKTKESLVELMCSFFPNMNAIFKIETVCIWKNISILFFFLMCTSISDSIFEILAIKKLQLINFVLYLHRCKENCASCLPINYITRKIKLSSPGKQPSVIQLPIKIVGKV